MDHQQFGRSIAACNDCADACDFCAAACLREPDATAMARCIALDIDCAQLCRVAAGFMARGSESAADLCQMCAEVCDLCAGECGKHPMQHCQDCAAACKRCADECRGVGGMPPADAPGAGAAASGL
jgi:hypothetical protein